MGYTLTVPCTTCIAANNIRVYSGTAHFVNKSLHTMSIYTYPCTTLEYLELAAY